MKIKTKIIFIIFTIVVSLHAGAFQLDSLEQIERLVKVIELPLSDTLNPVFSPNGRYLAYTTQNAQGKYTPKILDTENWINIEIGHYSGQSSEWLSNNILTVKSQDRKSTFFSIAKGEIVDDTTEEEMLQNTTGTKAMPHVHSLKTLTPASALTLTKGETVLFSIPIVYYLENIKISPSGQYMTFSGAVDESYKIEHSLDAVQGIFLWRKDNGAIQRIGGDGSVHNAFSSDERFLLYEKVSGYSTVPDDYQEHSTVSLWIMELKTGNHLQLTQETEGKLNCLALSSNGLICFATDRSMLGFYRLKLKQPEGTPFGE